MELRSLPSNSLPEFQLCLETHSHPPQAQPPILGFLPLGQTCLFGCAWLLTSAGSLVSFDPPQNQLILQRSGESFPNPLPTSLLCGLPVC